MKLIVHNLISVTYPVFVESLLQLFNKEHWLEKKELKSSVFSLKSIVKQYSWHNGGISGFFLFRKIFSKDQLTYLLTQLNTFLWKTRLKHLGVLGEIVDNISNQGYLCYGDKSYMWHFFS